MAGGSCSSRWDRPTSAACIADPLADANVQRVSDRESGYRFMPPAHVLFARQGALWARGLSRDFTRVEGEFVPVAPKVLVHRGVFGYAAFSSSSTGSIAYRASAGETQLVWLDRSGRPAGTVGHADDSQLSLEHLSRMGAPSLSAARSPGTRTSGSSIPNVACLAG